MKLFSFEHARTPRIGAEFHGQLVDLQAAHAALVMIRGPSASPLREMPARMLPFLHLGQAAFAAVRDILQFIARRPALPTDTRVLLLFDEVQLLPPLPRPGKILCSLPTAESGGAHPGGFRFFVKMPSSVIAPNAQIVCPTSVKHLDCNVALAAIIGEKLKAVSETDAPRAIAGYTILNDVVARDQPFSQPPGLLARLFDTFCPMGPCLITPDEIPDPLNLHARTLLNGTAREDNTLTHWQPALAQAVSQLSHIMTLEPGDVVSTAAPSPQPALAEPPRPLRPGDHIRLEIDGIGVLENSIVATPKND